MSNVDVNAETEPPPEQEPFADAPCDYAGCKSHWSRKVTVEVIVPRTGMRWTDEAYLCADHVE